MQILKKKHILTCCIGLLISFTVLLGGIVMIVSSDRHRNDSLTSSAATSAYNYTFPNQVEGYTVLPFYNTTFSINASQLKVGCNYYWLSTVDLSFVDANNRPVTHMFTVTPSRFTSVQPRQNASITVRVKHGLTPGTHTAYLIAKGTRNGVEHITSGAKFKFTITITGKPPAPTWGTTLTGNHTFAPADEGYTSAPTQHTATVTSTGNQPTGDLTVSLRGQNPNSFLLNGNGSSASLLSIAAGSTRTFTVRPRADLEKGKHTAIVAVGRAANNSNSLITEKSFTVTFVVRSYGITLSPTDHSFGEFNAGYTIGAAQTRNVVISNIGNQPTGAISITKAGANPDAFDVNASTAESIIAQNGTRTFTVKPKTGISAGIYSAVITVSCSEPKISSKQLAVRFYVSSPSLSVSIAGADVDGNGTYIFPAMDVGYPTPPEAYTARLTNSGNQVSSAISLSLSGANASSFELSPSSLSPISASGNATFTIRPKHGLSALTNGAHNATVTINGTGIWHQFNVSFLVRSYGISLSQKNEFVFPDANKDVHMYFNMPASKTITITNTGNQPTGTLTASVSNSDSFAVSAISPSVITSIGGKATFTVRVNNELASGLHTATVTVKGANTPEQKFDVRFFIKELGISLDQKEGVTYNFPSLNEGYKTVDLQSLTITITNTGNWETGELEVGLWGGNQEGFDLSTETISSIAVGGNVTFTVTPKSKLIPGSHSANISVYGDYMAAQNCDVSFRVISLRMELSEDHLFPETAGGYTTPPRHTVTIHNIGQDAIEKLHIEVLKGNDNFVIEKTSVENIPSKQLKTFDIWPAMNLLPGAYFLTVLITDHENLSAQFNAIFAVTFSQITLSHSELALSNAPEGYTTTYAYGRAVTVTNIGSAATGQVNLSLADGAVDSFALSRYTISNIAVDQNTTFTITPALGLKRGSYSVVVKVGNDYLDDQYVTVSIYVGGFGILLSESGLYPFADGRIGYYSPTELEVVVTNIGDNATGSLLVSVKDEGGFTLNFDTTYGARINLSSINSTKGTARFKVMPVHGLAPGRYTVTVTVSGDKVASQSFDVTFAVYSVSCPCPEPLPNNNTTLLSIIFSMLGIAVLLWLGLRKLPIPPEIQEEHEEIQKEEELTNLLFTGASGSLHSEEYEPKSRSRSSKKKSSSATSSLFEWE